MSMTSTLPLREKTTRWVQGDTLFDGRTRWAVDRVEGEVVHLRALNVVNHDIEWHTTMDRLPAKAVA